MQVSVGKSLTFAWQRVLGTIAGVLFTAAIAPYVGLSGWSLGLLLFIGAAIAVRFNLDHAIMVQVTLSILLVMYFQSKMPSYPLDRIRDTLIGAAFAVLFQMLIFPPDSLNKAQKKTTRFADHLSRQFFLTAQWVDRGCPSAEASVMAADVQGLFAELHQATKEVEQAGQSLSLNPFARNKRKRLNHLNRRLDQLRLGYANLADMIRVLTQWSATPLFTEEDRRIWVDHLNRIGAFIKKCNSVQNDQTIAAFDPSVLNIDIRTPAAIGNYQYPLALYTNAEQLVQDFRNPAFFVKE